MKYEIIGSSSKGNAIVLEDIILLDCGVSYTKLYECLKKIKLIFVSHLHKDHLLPSTIKKIAYEHPNIKFIVSSYDVYIKLTDCGVNRKNVYKLNPNVWYDLKAFKVKTQPVFHDVQNHCIHIEINGKKAIYIVDTNNVNNITAKNYDLFLIENNYQKDVLQKHIDECEDENKLYYLNRVPKTHLSAEECNSFLIENMGDNSEFCYIHQSTYNYEGDE